MDHSVYVLQKRRFPEDVDLSLVTLPAVQVCHWSLFLQSRSVIGHSSCSPDLSLVTLPAVQTTFIGFQERACSQT